MRLLSTSLGIVVLLVVLLGERSSGQLTMPESVLSPVSAFVEYLSIDTFQPRPDYAKAVEFLSNYATSLGLAVYTESFVPGKPVLIVSLTDDWQQAFQQQSVSAGGGDGNGKYKIPAVVLYSHMDVVPAEYAKWTRVGGTQQRGSQDMKCVTIQHLHALASLKRTQSVQSGHEHGRGGPMTRNVIAVMTPDEEIGGMDGVIQMRSSAVWQFLNVRLVVDEGLASGADSVEVPVFFAEKAPLWFRLRATGPPGHGSRFTTETVAATRMMRTVTRLLSFRDSQRDYWIAKGASVLDLGDLVTINLSYLKGGRDDAMNVVPSALEAGFDLRVPPSIEISAIKTMLEEWVKEDGCEITYVQEFESNPVTAVPPAFYSALRSVFTKHGVQLRPAIFPASTDSRHLRVVGYPAIGISYMPQTPIMLHEHDERLEEDIFLKGVAFFEDLAVTLAFDESF
eukprot:ANDGO_03648.mRNA.1 Aminoacylase-1